MILDGRERVLWRAAGGRVQLWEDRCPHRGMRLSLGFVRGDGLNCLYHGWEYATDARCLRIPAHPDLVVPPTIRARPFPVAEAGAMIWTASAGEADMPVLDDARPVASLAVEASADLLLELIGAEPRSDMNTVALVIAGTPVRVGWHVVGGRRTMLHVVAEAEGDTAAILASLRALRTRAEARQAA